MRSSQSKWWHTFVLVPVKHFAGADTTEKPSTIPMPKTWVKLGDEFNGLQTLHAQVHADVYAGGFLMIGGAHMG
ncbi:MAG: hypothetical protein IPN09_06300 [Bacteroidetes bacterium]|nr:hypothetical protein [Bacteroidota bacterium]